MHAWARLNAALDADPLRARRIAAGVIVAVTVARIALALLTPTPEMSPDGHGYDDAARRLVATGEYAWVYWPDEVIDPPRNAQQMPGYAVFLAGLYAVAGPDASAQPLVSVAQAIISGLTLWGVFLLGAHVAGHSAGLTSTLLGACYAPFWLSYREVLTEEIFLALCVWAAVALALALSGTRRTSMGLFALTGVLLAGATYIRAASAAWAVLAAAAVILGSPRSNRTYLLRGAAVVTLVATMCFAPWWYRNASIYEGFVPFNTLTATSALVPTLETEAERERVLADLAGPHLMPEDELAYNERVAAVARARLDEKLATDPAGYVWRKARALGISVLTYHPNPFGGFTGVGGIVELTHLGLLGLAGIGWWRHRREPLALALLALPVALVLVHAPTLSFSRYFYPMMGFVTVMAGVGLRGLPASPPSR